MPLHNHFVAPLRFTHPWSGFHGTWATMIARQLNQDILPPGFYAIPTVELGGPVEIDVAAVEDVSGPPDGKALLTQAWHTSLRFLPSLGHYSYLRAERKLRWSPLELINIIFSTNTIFTTAALKP